jgi:hypothetical protein
MFGQWLTTIYRFGFMAQQRQVRKRLFHPSGAVIAQSPPNKSPVWKMCGKLWSGQEGTPEYVVDWVDLSTKPTNGD